MGGRARGRARSIGLAAYARTPSTTAATRSARTARRSSSSGRTTNERRHGSEGGPAGRARRELARPDRGRSHRAASVSTRGPGSTPPRSSGAGRSTGRTSSPRRRRSRAGGRSSQYRDLMQLVLLGAAIVSIVALQEWSTGLVIIGLTVLNAVLGLNQEGKAAESVAALQKMLLIHAHVRRAASGRTSPPRSSSRATSSPSRPATRSRRRAADPGRDAGDRGGGADRREHAGAEVGRPGGRRGHPPRRPRRHGLHELDRDARSGRDGRHGDGMATEVGQISGMLAGVKQEKTPLTRQLDQLTVLDRSWPRSRLRS